jgi:cis-3-alkyl-4-acyloxetan-2-one decarboxylase
MVMPDSSLTNIPPWLRAEYPFTPQDFITPRGARLSYLDEGPRTDEAVLMVHGNPTWSFYFRHLVQALRPTMRCIVPDHVGMGLSAKPEDYSYTLATRIDDIAALIERLELKRVHLVVHDWGGAIGFGFAARKFPGIGRIVVLNTAAFCSDQIPNRIAICKTPLIGPFLVRGLNGFAAPATRMAMHRRKLNETEKRGYLWPYNSWGNRIAVSAFVRDIPLRPSHPSWPTLHAVEQTLPQFRERPVLVVWGGRDFCFNDHFLARWRQFLPLAKVHRIADAGHYVLEDARDEVLPLISSFFLRRG